MLIWIRKILKLFFIEQETTHLPNKKIFNPIFRKVIYGNKVTNEVDNSGESIY